MSLDEFLHDLQFRPNQVNPEDLEVDWEDAPHPYKLYRGLPVISLSAEIPLTLEGRDLHAEPSLAQMGHLLWYVYGLTQISHALAVLGLGDEMVPFQSNRRFVPSGGALYPSELYVYLKLAELSPGIYHYDAAHHRLVLLREGNYDGYLSKALGDRCDVSGCFGVAFVSTMFWKNFFKYHDFAYRLQGLDAGAVIGQLLEVVKRFDIATGVHFQFLDRAVNHLLGFAEKEESVYAVIPLTKDPEKSWDSSLSGARRVKSFTAAELSDKLSGLSHQHFVRSQRVHEYPSLIAMNEASMLESTQSFGASRDGLRKRDEGEGIALPAVARLDVNLAECSRNRFSPERDFTMGRVSEKLLASLLMEATSSFAYLGDVNAGKVDAQGGVSLYVCLNHVDGVEDGAYRYDCATHMLHPVRYGDHRLWLLEGLAIDNVNMYQVPICFHIAGSRDHEKGHFGYRGYRIQQMEAGMLTQRLVLTASACGMGGHPLLGFDVNLCDELYRLSTYGETCLIQIPVGPYRPRARLQGGLHG